MTVVLAWLTATAGFGAFLLTALALARSIRNGSKADREKRIRTQALEVKDAVREARADEHSKCLDRMNQILAEKRAIEKDRDYERGRADQLQTLINQRGLGPDKR